MPDRMIRDRCRRSPTLQHLSDAAERAWWRLVATADDYGRFEADPEVLLADLFARRPAGWTDARVARVLDEWETVGLVHRYADAAGRVYGHILTWALHQRHRDSKPRFPDPPCGDSPQSAANCGESRQFAAPSEGRSNGIPRDVVPKPRGEVLSPDGDSPPPPAVWPTPEALVALYNAHSADECPAVEKLTPARRQRALRYLRTFPEEDFWLQAFSASRDSRLLRGQAGGPGHEHFRASFDWYLSVGKDGAENAVKAWEGKYRG